MTVFPLVSVQEARILLADHSGQDRDRHSHCRPGPVRALALQAQRRVAGSLSVPELPLPLADVVGHAPHVFGGQLEPNAGLVMGQLLLRLPEFPTQLLDRLLLALGQLSKADGEEGSFDGVERPRAVRIPEAPKLVKDLRQLTWEEGHPSTRYAQGEQGTGSHFKRYSLMIPGSSSRAASAG